MVDLIQEKIGWYQWRSLIKSMNEEYYDMLYIVKDRHAKDYEIMVMLGGVLVNRRYCGENSPIFNFVYEKESNCDLPLNYW